MVPVRFYGKEVDALLLPLEKQRNGGCKCNDHCQNEVDVLLLSLKNNATEAANFVIIVKIVTK